MILKLIGKDVPASAIKKDKKKACALTQAF
jgi:hypothetical protein